MFSVLPPTAYPQGGRGPSFYATAATAAASASSSTKV